MRKEDILCLSGSEWKLAPIGFRMAILNFQFFHSNDNEERGSICG